MGQAAGGTGGSPVPRRPAACATILVGRGSVVLAIRPGALGDALLAVSAVRALRARFPRARLHLVGQPKAAELLCRAGEIDSFSDFDAPDVTGLFSATASTTGLEQLQPVEAAVAWLSDPQGVVASQLRRLGAQRMLVAPSRPGPGAGQHAADYLLASLAPWAVPTPAAPEVLPLRLPAEPGEGAFLKIGLVVHPGSGSVAKNWPAERFAEVLRRLTREDGLRAALVCGPADEAACAAVLRHAALDLPVLRFDSLVALARALVRARAYLGNDSGVSHLAALLGVPTIALFEPTDPAVWAPRGPRVRVLDFSAAPEEVAAAVGRMHDAAFCP